MQFDGAVWLRKEPSMCFFWSRRGLNRQQFIDCLTQRTNWANDSLHIQDHPVRAAKTKMAGYSVLLVDTPGFDDYSKTADDVLEEIKPWLLKK